VKRSEQLKSLSHEHHHALFVAKRLRDEGSGATTAFAEFWKSEGEAHFRIEEEVLLPGSGLEGPGSDPDVARMLDEHLDIRRRVRRILEGDASEDEFGELGVALTSHVRFEERELFPRIESLLDQDGLDDLASRIAAAESAST
jgi:hemerythrin-like domain-containing protein